MCHLHHTHFHFPVVCCLLAKVFQARLERKVCSSQRHALPTGPILGLKLANQGLLCAWWESTCFTETKLTTTVRHRYVKQGHYVHIPAARVLAQAG